MPGKIKINERERQQKTNTKEQMGETIYSGSESWIILLHV